MLRLLSWLACRPPLRLALAVGRLLGLLWYYLLPIRRATARRNIRLAYGHELSDREQRRVCRACFVNLGQYLIEDLRLPLLDGRNAGQLVRYEGFDHYAAALARGKGVVILCSHNDSWDLMALSQAHQGIPLLVPVRLVKNRAVQDFIERLRRAAGMGLAEPRGSFPLLQAQLEAGRVVAMMLDQHLGPGRGIVVEFFGQPASTSPGAAVLAQRTGAPVVPVNMVRQRDGTHRLFVQPALEYQRPFADEADNVRYNTQLYTWLIEGWTRAVPGSWLWLHRRWKALDDPRFAAERAAFAAFKERLRAAGLYRPPSTA